MTGGTASLADMVARTERGLLLTTLWYIRTVDPSVLLLTGLTRDGVYLVEDGQVTAAVNNFRFNESPLDLLRRAGEPDRVLPVVLERKTWSDLHASIYDDERFVSQTRKMVRCGLPLQTSTSVGRKLIFI